MDLIEFINFAKKHRLSVKHINYPHDNDGWIELFGEALLRNNSVLLDELYSKCPEEYKKNIENYISNMVFSRVVKYKNEYSQTILNWVFDHLDVDIDSVFNPVFVAENARGDLIDFLIKDNLQDIFAERLYNISKWLAKEGQVELFKKIADKLDLNNFHETNDAYKYTKVDNNPFIQLFDNARDKETLKYILENIPNDKEYYLKIIKTCAATFKYMVENIEHNDMLDITLNFFKNNRPEYYNELKHDILDKDSKLVFKNINRLSILNVKTLENHGMFTTYLLYRSIETVGGYDYQNILESSLHFLYDNFDESKIDEAFTQKHKMELFSNLMIRDSAKEAQFIYNKAPYILNDEVKDYITSALLRKGGKSGVEWAKMHLTYDEIDSMTEKSFYQRNLEQLTLWKCENFLYSEEKNNSNKLEKKKIKL